MSRCPSFNWTWDANACFKRLWTPATFNDCILLTAEYRACPVAENLVFIVKRLRAAGDKNATVNALVHLDVFARRLTPGLAEAMDRLRHFFDPILKSPNTV
jgi:hypothetical protein